MRSAWLKLARTIEHQKYLARLGREIQAAGPAYRYERDDNCQDSADEIIRATWQVRVLKPYPERWGVVLGDVVGAMRAALDHAMWTAVETHSGPPARPQPIAFPITSTDRNFTRQARELAPLVSPETWKVVDALQPRHGGDQAHLAPLEILRWLSNVDKHRHLHIVGRTQVDLGLPVVVSPQGDLDVVEQEIFEGQAIDGATVGRVVLRRPADSRPVDLLPTFAHTASVQICDFPEIEYRPLSGVMPVMIDAVSQAIFALGEVNGFDMPALDDLELGEEHEAFAPEFGGAVATYQDLSGNAHTVQLPDPDSTAVSPDD